MNKLMGLIFLGGALMVGCAYQHRMLINPQASIPPKVTQSDVQKAIRQSLANYGWVVEKEEPGSTIAHHQKGELYAQIEVQYDNKIATVRHLETKNMNYQKSSSGEETIHGHYLTWANNVAQKINENLYMVAY